MKLIRYIATVLLIISTNSCKNKETPRKIVANSVDVSTIEGINFVEKVDLKGEKLSVALTRVQDSIAEMERKNIFLSLSLRFYDDKDKKINVEVNKGDELVHVVDLISDQLGGRWSVQQGRATHLHLVIWHVEDGDRSPVISDFEYDTRSLFSKEEGGTREPEDFVEEDFFPSPED